MQLWLTSVGAWDHGGHRAHKQIHDELTELHKGDPVQHLGEHVGKVGLGRDLTALEGVVVLSLTNDQLTTSDGGRSELTSTTRT